MLQIKPQCFNCKIYKRDVINLKKKVFTVYKGHKRKMEEHNHMIKIKKIKKI
jgi:hypothetical protein